MRSAVALRPYAAADAPWLDTWLPAAVQSVGYTVPPLNAPALLARVILRDRQPGGLVIARTQPAPSRRAVIEFIGVPPQETRRGAGMEAARLIEAELHRSGVTAIFAPAPAAHGIAVYFWVRLGYAPLLRPGWPCEREGVAWLARDISSGLDA